MSNHHEEMEAHYATGRDRQDLEHADELIAGLKAENARLREGLRIAVEELEEIVSFTRTERSCLREQEIASIQTVAKAARSALGQRA